MHYVELDVNNLRRWLLPAGAAGKIAGAGEFAKNDNGFIIYFSDRRNNKNGATTPVETGEYGWEDTVNLGNAAGTVYGTLDAGEDVNGSDGGLLEQYGRIARNTGPNAVAPLTSAALVTDKLTANVEARRPREHGDLLPPRPEDRQRRNHYRATPYSCSAPGVPCNNIIAPG